MIKVSHKTKLWTKQKKSQRRFFFSTKVNNQRRQRMEPSQASRQASDCEHILSLFRFVCLNTWQWSIGAFFTFIHCCQAHQAKPSMHKKELEKLKFISPEIRFENMRFGCTGRKKTQTRIRTETVEQIEKLKMQTINTIIKWVWPQWDEDAGSQISLFPKRTWMAMERQQRHQHQHHQHIWRRKRRMEILFLAQWRWDVH